MKNIKSIDMFESSDDLSAFDEEFTELERLEEILNEIEGLMYEANEIVERAAKEVDDRIIYERWRAYPYNNIMTMLSKGSKYDTSFSDIIKEIANAMKGNDNY